MSFGHGRPSGFISSESSALDLFCEAFDNYRSNSDLPVCILTTVGWMTQIYTDLSISTSLKPSIIQSNKARGLAWAWLTRPRAQSEQLALVDTECTCKTPLPLLTPHRFWHVRGQDYMQEHEWQREKFETPLHAPPGDNIEKPFWCFMSTICHTFDLIASDNKEGPKVHRPHRLRQRREWPRSVKDLLPHGPEDTFRGFCSWFYLSPDRPAWDSMSSLLAFLLIMCKTQINTCAVHSTALHIGVFEEWRRATEVAMIADMGTVQARNVWINYEMVMQQSTDLLHVLLMQCFDEVQTIAFIESESWLKPEHILIMCTRMIRHRLYIDHLRKEGTLPREEHGSELLLKNAQVAGQLMAYFPNIRLQNGEEDILVFIQKCAPRPNNPNELIWFRLRKMILHLWEREHCAAPGCRRTSVDCGHLSYCGGCKIARYCSRRCQKAAWKHPAAPHRSACAAYAGLFTTLGLGARTHDQNLDRALGSLREPLAPYHTFVPFAKTVLNYEQARTRWEMDHASNLYGTEDGWTRNLIIVSSLVH